MPVSLVTIVIVVQQKIIKLSSNYFLMLCHSVHQKNGYWMSKINSQQRQIIVLYQPENSLLYRP